MANRNIHSPKGNMKYPTNSPMTKISCTNMELTIPISTLWRISLTAPQNNGSRQRNGVSKWANHPTNFCHGVRHSSHISSVSLNECFCLAQTFRQVPLLYKDQQSRHSPHNQIKTSCIKIGTANSTKPPIHHYDFVWWKPFLYIHTSTPCFISLCTL